VRKSISLIALLAPGIAAFAQSDQTDRALERYLERLGQRTLLIEHLDRRLARTSGAERAALAERLTKLLAQELEAATTGARRAELERRARALLDVIPEGDSIDLRLSLHRATYAHAEEIAERWRLRLATSEELEEAKRIFSQLGGEFARLGSAANRRVENLERLEEAARTGMDEQDIATQLADSRRQRSMSMYLSAWCLTYQAELESARAPALEAIPRFGWLLNAEPGQSPSIDRVPEHTLTYEHVARAAIGVATAIGVAGDFGLATRWLDMVEDSKGVETQVLAQSSKRRMVLLANNARWTELHVLVKAMRGESESAPDQPATPLDVATARLLVVLASELPSGREAPAQLAIRRAAFGDLAARNEVAQVVDLASRYGTEALGAGGFIADYVRGLQAYRAATARQQEAGEIDTPTSDPGIRQQFVNASRLLESALGAPDAQANGAARADAAILFAASTYLAGAGEASVMRLAAKRAALAYDVALDHDRRADALWLQIRALRAARDIATESGADPNGAESARLAAEDASIEFTRQFPQDPRAGALVLERASTDRRAGVDPGALDALLAIDRASPSYESARRRAAAMLYESASRAKGPDARPAAIRFVEVAGPLLDADAQRALAGDASVAPQAALMARQAMALLLADQVSEAGLAARAADRLEELVRAGLIDEPAVLAELRYRQLQIALLSDDAPEIDAALSSLASLDETVAGRYLVAADRLAYRHALALWRQSPDDPVRAGQVVRYGVRVLSSLTDGAASESDPAIVSTLMLVSDAASVLWRARSDADALLLSRRLLRRALAVQPNSIDLLTRAARLANDAGDYPEAAETWDRVRSGAELGTELWFRATTERFVSLARADASVAAEELANYFDLYPDGGPAPWGDRLRNLRRELEERAP
jgi:hypothetical protein